MEGIFSIDVEDKQIVIKFNTNDGTVLIKLNKTDALALVRDMINTLEIFLLIEGRHPIITDIKVPEGY